MQIVNPTAGRAGSTVILCAATFALFALSVAGLFHRPRYFELASHFRLQYLWAAALCGVCLTWRRVWTWALLAGAIVIFNGLFIAPLYRHPRLPASAGVSLKVMLSNVMGGNRNYAAVLREVRAENPDILVIEECTPLWWQNLEILKADYPHSEAVLQYGGGGIALFSRFPLENVQVHRVGGSVHTIITARVNLNGTRLEILAMHPLTPVTDDKFSERNRQLAWAADYMRGLTGPRILIGDLNTTLFSPYFQDLVRDSGLHNARQGQGLLPSWPARYDVVPAIPPFLRIPIDHCLVSDEISVARIRLGPRVGSDHLPLLVDLVIAK